MDILSTILNYVPLLADPVDAATGAYSWCYSTTEGQGIDQLKRIITLVINLIKIVIPIGLIILGMLDLGKAVLSQKEDDIKKGQSTFIKRLVAAVVMFLIIFAVQIIINLASGNDSALWDCVNGFFNYKTQ